MNCCHKHPHSREAGSISGSWWRRIRKCLSLILPSVALVLMPKCPLCFAAYLALGTGVTLSYQSAHIVMQAVTWLCIGTLAFIVGKRLVRFLPAKHTPNLQLSHS